ncbi:MAG: hypothetical protein IOD12_09360 [Silvanigrellales bacterium]|jgi:hypothetical protein|nr:hypothetical protein [Silvanigrellales bacterium]
MTFSRHIRSFFLATLVGSPLVSLSSCGPALAEKKAEAFAESQVLDARPEPFAGDLVNNSPWAVLVWGDNVGGPGVSYACVPAGVSTHNWPGNIDVDFAYSASLRMWCKIGAGEARVENGGAWWCPEGWSQPPYLRYDLGC